MIVKLQLKATKKLVAIKAPEVAAVEQREDCCWIYLKSGVGFEVTEDYNFIMDMLKYVDEENWNLDNYEGFNHMKHMQ